MLVVLAGFLAPGQFAGLGSLGICQLYPSLSPHNEVIVDQCATCGVAHLRGPGGSVDHI